jgi:ABC-type transporter Mla MlaB component
MPLQATYIDEEGRLDLVFEGDLDLTLTQGVCDVCRNVSPNLRTCIVDLSAVERVFDSGLALLQMLHRRFSELGASVIALTDHPRICAVLPVCGSPDSDRRSCLIS